MLAAEPPTTTTASPHLGHRKPLQPKHNNIFNFTTNNTTIKTNHYDIISPKPKQTLPLSSLSPSPIISNSNKENINTDVINMMNIQLMDASLAEELTAVKQKLERLKNDKDKTCELLQQRNRVLEVQMTELINRGQFQKELEIEVDRLYRLKHLKLACLRMSPIRSLREKEMEKKKNNKEEIEPTVSEEKSGETANEELVDESSTSDSPTMSATSSPVSASASASASASTGARSTATSKKLPITLRLLSLETDLDDK